jgi:hypothetical protein
VGPFQPKPSVVHEKFDDETVTVNLDTGCYFSLRGSADAIWALAAAGLSQPEIVARLREAYEGDAAEIEAAATAFLDRLVEESLLERAHREASKATVALEGGPFVPPSLQKYTDMEELLQLDPVHEVDNMGWPNAKPREL